MANATWQQATDECLRLASLDPFADADSFNNDSAEKYQLFAKYCVRLGNSHLGTRCHRHFADRRIPLITSAGQSTYALDTGISPESISVRSFFNATTTAGLSSKNGELRNWDYNEFIRANPDQTDLPEGAPTRWILLPIERTEISPAHKVQIYPTPDATYQLQFKAKLNPYALTSATSLILFPPEYQHALTEWVWNLLERDLGEGKEGMIAALAAEAAKQVVLVAGMPEDVRKAPRTMRLPGASFGRRTSYDSPQSVDGTTGAVMD